MNEKEPMTISIDNDIKQHQKNNVLIDSFSKWACDTYRAQFMDSEHDRKELSFHYDKIEEINQRIAAKQNIISALPDAAVEWVETEGVRLYKQNYDIDRCLIRFNNEFGLKLSKKIYKKMVEEAYRKEG